MTKYAFDLILTEPLVPSALLEQSDLVCLTGCSWNTEMSAVVRMLDYTWMHFVETHADFARRESQC